MGYLQDERDRAVRDLANSLTSLILDISAGRKHLNIDKPSALESITVQVCSR